MKHKDGKPGSQPDKSSRVVPMSIMFVVLCGFSFYLGGIFCSEKERFVTKEVEKAVLSPKESSSSPLQIKSVAFPECSREYQDYTPCTDPRVSITSSLISSFYRPFHSPGFALVSNCLHCVCISIVTEMEKIWSSSSYFYGTPLSPSIWKEGMLDPTTRWIQTTN